MKYIASCSFGKDSLAAIIVRAEHNEPVDAAVYCRIMFDDETSAELPEHEEWIHGHAIPLLKSRDGIETATVQAAKTYCDSFCTVVQRESRRKGLIWGFPTLWAPWCNSDLKVRPLDKWKNEIGEHTAIVGIAADEPKRIDRGTVSGKALPLVDHNITEAGAYEICKKNDLLSPAYNGGRTRLGCWFCHNQRLNELRRLRHEYPRLWAKLLALDQDSPVTFKPDCTIRYCDERFAFEDDQISLFDDWRNA